MYQHHQWRSGNASQLPVDYMIHMQQPGNRSKQQKVVDDGAYVRSHTRFLVRADFWLAALHIGQPMSEKSRPATEQQHHRKMYNVQGLRSAGG